MGEGLRGAVGSGMGEGQSEAVRMRCWGRRGGGGQGRVPEREAVPLGVGVPAAVPVGVSLAVIQLVGPCAL